MPRTTVLGPATIGELVARIPAELRASSVAAARAGVEYTLLLFPHDRRDVVLSSRVRNAFDALTGATPLIAVGGNFTAEALALLAERDAVVVRHGEFYWTDASYGAVARGAT